MRSTVASLYVGLVLLLGAIGVLSWQLWMMNDRITILTAAVGHQAKAQADSAAAGRDQADAIASQATSIRLGTEALGSLSALDAYIRENVAALRATQRSEQAASPTPLPPARPALPSPVPPAVEPTTTTTTIPPVRCLVDLLGICVGVHT